MTTKIRGSQADIVMACAGSLEPTDAPYNPNSDEGREGSAKHAALAFVVRGEDPPLDSIAARFDVDVDELAKAVSYGRQAWAEVAQYYPDAKTEQKLDGAVTMGTADVLSLGGEAGRLETLAILDWKTGWSGDEHQYQLMAYADAARAQYGMPTSGYITAIEAWLRHREMSTRNFTQEQLEGFRERAAYQIKQAGKQYGPGGHCKFCRRQNQCPARDQYLRASVTALVPAEGEFRVITREVLGQLWSRSRDLAKALRAYESLVDEALVDGKIPLGDGKALSLETTEQDEIQPIGATAVLKSEFGWTDLDLAEVLSATKSGIERVVKGKVAKGGGAAAMRQILGRLRDVGAITKIEAKRKKVIEL